MNADIIVKVHGRDSTDLVRKIAAIDALARTPHELPSGPVEIPPADPPIEIVRPVDLPVLVAPYFDVGEATGKAGEIVELSIEGGCPYEMNGFHIGGGCGLLPDVPRSGYGKFEAVGFKLGPFLREYLESEDLIHDKPMHKHDHFWSVFQFAKARPHRALPEEWWDASCGFFSLDQARGGISPITIPSGTEILTVSIRILPDTAPGEYIVTCKDEWFFTQSHRRRRDFMFTVTRDSPFARGGITKLQTFNGKITVLAA